MKDDEESLKLKNISFLKISTFVQILNENENEIISSLRSCFLVRVGPVHLHHQSSEWKFSSLNFFLFISLCLELITKLFVIFCCWLNCSPEKWGDKWVKLYCMRIIINDDTIPSKDHICERFFGGMMMLKIEKMTLTE